MTFAERLAGLGFPTYDAYLRSDHWHAFKAEYYRSGHSMRCAVCGRRRVQLHHHTYKRLGGERLTDVTPLCREHHQAVHAWLKTNKAFVDQTAKAIKALRPPAPAKKRTPEQRKARAERRARRIVSRAEARRQRQAILNERDAKIAKHRAENAGNPMTQAVAAAMTGGFLRPFGHPINKKGRKPKPPPAPKRPKGPARTAPTPKVGRTLRVLRPRDKT